MQLKTVIPRGIRFLMRYGAFGRKKQVESFLILEENAGFNVNKNKQDQLYQKIIDSYREIRVHKLWSTRIGEYIPRFLDAVKNAEKNAERGILDVFILSDCVNHNARLSRIMGRAITVVDETNADLWKYVLERFPKVEFIQSWDEYADRNNDILLESNDTVKYFQLTEEEEREGQNKKETMGLYGPYVCIASRDAGYLNTINPDGDYSYHDYRDSDINRCASAAEYLSTQKIATVRMGRYTQRKAAFDNCIDYASEYYDELMDIVLMRDCKFCVSDSNGTCIFPMMLNRPLALKNVVPAFLDAWGTHPQSSQNIMIFKKYYSKIENRFLSIREMMPIDVQARLDAHKYVELQIEVVENSAEEILDLVVEMNSRINGEWVETQEDMELQKKYQDILDRWIEDAHLKRTAMYQGRIGAMFLRKNLFLLE